MLSNTQYVKKDSRHDVVINVLRFFFFYRAYIIKEKYEKETVYFSKIVNNFDIKKKMLHSSYYY